MTTVQMNDDLLRQYVDGVFERYDLDHSNTLTLDELVVFFNDLLISRGSHQKMTRQQVKQALMSMDTNSDGQITKTQLYYALKKINGSTSILGAQITNLTQIPVQTNSTFNTTVQYPNLATISPIKQVVQQTNQTNLYAKPQPALTNNFVTSQYIPSTTPKQTTYTQIQPTVMAIPQQIQQIVQPVYTQAVYMPPPIMQYGPPMFGPMMPPPMMGPWGMMGPMGPPPMMGMGPMGPPMGPFGMGMRMGMMNPLGALLGLFGIF